MRSHSGAGRKSQAAGRNPRRRERGAALIVSLIMLALITLLAVASFRLSRSNIAIVANLQHRTEGLAAAEDAIGAVVSSTQFTQTPATPIPTAAGPTNVEPVDVNGDQVTDVQVTVKALCDSIQPIPVMVLNFSDPNDQGCLRSVDPGSFGMAGAANNDSMCANSVWDINASALDVLTSANYVVDEGTAVRVPIWTTCP